MAPDPFDVASLRLTQDFTADIAVERVLTHIPVRRPNRQDFFQVHPAESFRLDTGVIELKEARETYLVASPLRAAVAQEITPVRLFTAITRQGTAFVWPAKLPPPDGRPNAWHASALDAAGRAMSQWVRIVPDMNAGCYQVYVAVANLPEPAWPGLSFQDILRLAFRDRLIDRPDHPVIQQLQGRS